MKTIGDYKEKLKEVILANAQITFASVEMLKALNKIKYILESPELTNKDELQKIVDDAINEAILNIQIKQ